MIELAHGSDRLHRGVKLALDSGEVSSIEEAQRLFETYRLVVAVGPDIARSATRQAALLTTVNAARRSFLGGVEVVGLPHGSNLLVPWRGFTQLGEAVEDLHGRIVENVEPGLPLVVFGDAPHCESSAFAIRATFDGWCGGVVPVREDARLPEVEEFTPAGVLCGALAVSEAFQYVRGTNPMAGRRRVGLSLWRPDSGVDWHDESARGPQVDLLPAKAWLIGLGHLGQAYLWTLGFLPYADPGDVHLVLQDFDDLADANDSTSPLTFPRLVGKRKTRAMATWCEARGFRTSIVERRFTDDFEVAPDEPSVALCGVDNSLARSALEDTGFKRVIEAGLGNGQEEYLAFQVHGFPGPQLARVRWSGTADNEASAQDLMPAYQNLVASGMDECGVTTLAGRTVGAPFVGLATSALVVSELIRMVMGEHTYTLLDGGLRDLGYRSSAARGEIHDPFNPGSAAAGGLRRGPVERTDRA